MRTPRVLRCSARPDAAETKRAQGKGIRLLRHIASPSRSLPAIFLLSLLIYLLALVIPYNLFSYVHQAPVSLGEIAQRRPPPAAIFLLAFAALFWLYSLAYRTCLRSPHRNLALPILLSGLVLALALSLTYPIGAGDVVDYVSHGEELAYFGLNPLVVPPGYVPGTTFARYSAFRLVPSNYGPLWTWISGLVVGALGRESLALNLLGFKAVAISAYLGQAVLIYTILRRRSPRYALPGLLFFAWNPLILYEFAVNGHNDAAMMFFALLGMLLWERGRPLAMATALTLSFLIKIPTILLLPLFLLASVRRWGWRVGLQGGALALGLTGLAYLSLPDPLAALTNLSGRSGLLTHSLPAVVSMGLRQAGVPEATARALVQTATLLALGGWYLSRLRRVWRSPSHALPAAYDVILFLLLFATPWFQPWYVTWLIALASLHPRRSAPTQAGLLSLTVIISYVIYGFLWFWIAPIANWGHGLGINLIAVGTTYLLPWAYAAWTWGAGRDRTNGPHKTVGLDLRRTDPSPPTSATI
ncbi:MAG TPA: hypothetical protein G4O00_00855 [Thermoflexia bacterium]|nr:hypothetical protein [Thermoflexia bacterium]